MIYPVLAVRVLLCSKALSRDTALEEYCTDG
jgi:hypothetical protein